MDHLFSCRIYIHFSSILCLHLYRHPSVKGFTSASFKLVSREGLCLGNPLLAYLIGLAAVAGNGRLLDESFTLAQSSICWHLHLWDASVLEACGRSYHKLVAHGAT